MKCGKDSCDLQEPFSFLATWFALNYILCNCMPTNLNTFGNRHGMIMNIMNESGPYDSVCCVHTHTHKVQNFSFRTEFFFHPLNWHPLNQWPTVYSSLP